MTSLFKTHDKSETDSTLQDTRTMIWENDCVPCAMGEDDPDCRSHTHFQILSSRTPKLICDAQMSSEFLSVLTKLCIMHMALLFLTTTDSL